MGDPPLLGGQYGEVLEFPDFVYHQSDPRATMLFDKYAITPPPMPTPSPIFMDEDPLLPQYNGTNLNLASGMPPEYDFSMWQSMEPMPTTTHEQSFIPQDYGTGPPAVELNPVNDFSSDFGVWDRWRGRVGYVGSQHVTQRQASDERLNLGDQYATTAPKFNFNHEFNATTCPPFQPSLPRRWRPGTFNNSTAPPTADLHPLQAPVFHSTDFGTSREDDSNQRKHLPTERKRLKFKSVVVYRGALRRGDPLLCLPRKVRNRIFSYLLADFPETRYIEVPDTKDLYYPLFTEFSDLWYTETCELIIQRATFSINSDAAVFSLMVFLNEFELHEGYENVRSLKFTNMDVFEKGVFSANSTKLLRRCPNIKHISLLIDFRSLIWTSQISSSGRDLDICALTEKYDLHAVAQLPKLKTVTLNLTPYMALQKHLSVLEAERQEAVRRGCIVPGLDSFWGLKEWLVIQAMNQSRLIDVICPQVSGTHQHQQPDTLNFGIFDHLDDGVPHQDKGFNSSLGCPPTTMNNLADMSGTPSTTLRLPPGMDLVPYDGPQQGDYGNGITQEYRRNTSTTAGTYIPAFSNNLNTEGRSLRNQPVPPASLDLDMMPDFEIAQLTEYNNSFSSY